MRFYATVNESIANYEVVSIHSVPTQRSISVPGTLEDLPVSVGMAYVRVWVSRPARRGFASVVLAVAVKRKPVRTRINASYLNESRG